MEVEPPTLQEGRGVAQLANTFSPMLAEFRDGLMSIGSSVLKKLKAQAGRGAGQKAPAKPRKAVSKTQSGRGRAKNKVQKGKGAATTPRRRRQPAAQKGRGSAQQKKKPPPEPKKKPKKANF